MDDRAIGVFDSGLGGLTAVKVLEELLPHENIVFFGDSGRMPYGGRSRDEITAFAVQDAVYLTSFDVKAVLIACGTITSNSIGELRSHFAEPFFGVVDAACAAAAKRSKTGRIGVIATEATIRSGVYESGIRALRPDARVLSKACPPFAAMVERGHFRPGDPEAEKTVAEQLAVFEDSGIDTLLLGCTHYPLLSEVIAARLPGAALISAGAEAARELAGWLGSRDLLSGRPWAGERRYITSGDPAVFARGAGLFLGRPIAPERHII